VPEEDIEEVLQIFGYGAIYNEECYSGWQNVVNGALSRDLDYTEREALFRLYFWLMR